MEATEVLNDGVDILDQAPTDVANAEANGGTAPKRKRAKQGKRDVITFVLPKELLELVKNQATAVNKSTAEWARELVAEQFNFTLPPMSHGGGGGKRRYASKEEAKAAKQAKAAERNKLINALLEKARTGEIDLSALGINIPVPAARAPRVGDNSEAPAVEQEAVAV